MLSNTCPVCGLPTELCVCQEVDKTTSLIEIKIERRKYGKFWAVISGIDTEPERLKEIMKSIKNKLACGGTIKGKKIEVLFGKSEKTKNLIEVLVGEGFNKDSIHINTER